MLSLISKDLGNPDEFLGTIGEAPLSHPIYIIEKIIIYIIGEKGNIIILLDRRNSLPCLFFGVSNNPDLPIIIWDFNVAINIPKCPHLSSILISRAENIDDVSLFF